MSLFLPEELLVRILVLALADVALLRVSRQFCRIASPLCYHTLSLQSPHQTNGALVALTRRPALANAVRRVTFTAISHNAAAILALCHHVQDIDISLDTGTDLDAEAFCNALEQHHAIVHLTVRKSPDVYLTHPRSILVLQRLALAVHHWPNLETVHFAFRIASSPSTLPLARALSVAPRLRSVRTPVPAVWNNLLLIISTNPRLEKVMLYVEPIPSRPSSIGSAVIKCDDIEHAVLGTGLYMMEAKKHPRLSELIKCGTVIIRTRAHTTISTLSTSSGGTPLGPIRAKELADELMSNRDTTVVPFAVPRRTYTQDM